MIQSTSQSHSSFRADAIPPAGSQSPAPKKLDAASTDSLSTDNAESLHRALASTPEIRPEVVEMGHHLAVDPNYPPRQIIEQLAKMFTESADPAELG